MGSEFKSFAQAVYYRLLCMSEESSEFYKVNCPDIFDRYLQSFPTGTNPIFRERTEHDCQCCKQFIRNLGLLVTIKDNQINTVWGDLGELPAPYGEVAKAMDAIVKGSQIESVFRRQETSFGVEKNLDSKANITWYHFYGKTPKEAVSSSPGTEIGKAMSAFSVLKRGLEELRQSDLDEILDLIEDKSLYRGEEHEKSVREFRSLQEGYAKAQNKDLFVWENIHSPAALFKNSVIGTLAVDLAEEIGLEKAVKRFESKVAPQNYKRPKALITPRMIEDAVAKLRELDLEDAIDRRLATAEDLSVNDVLFVDNSVVSKMKGGLTDLLLSSNAVKKTRKLPDNPTKISIEDFIALGSKSVELILGNEHLGNFVTLTAPVHDDVKNLFKWRNSFGWSYDGGVADSMRELVVSRGGRVDGVFRFTHQWNYAKRNTSLMDLHVFMPCKETEEHRDGCHDQYPRTGLRVGWNNRQEVRSGGIQDVDYTNAAPEGYVPIENITFPSLERMPEGKYVCKIHNWAFRSPTRGGFKAEIEFGGQIFEYELDRPLRNKEWVTVAEVTLSGGAFSIEHKLPTTSSPREKWGVKTQDPVKVQMIMLSPNHWENAGGIGNKHWFFILDGCRVDEPVRGIYNEFLIDSLYPHRKVFEVLGSKTKCQPSDRQLSGVGFSSTRSDSVNVIADGRPFTITF